MSVQSSRWLCLFRLVSPAALVLLLSLSARADEESKPDSPKADAPKAEQPEGIRFTIPHLKIAGGELKIGGGEGTGYWIGVVCHPVDAELRGKLKLDEGQGVVIDEVRPDSPAAKAGLKKDDVVLAAAGKPLATVKQLADAVAEAKTGKLKLQVLSQGKRQEIEVQPAQRAAENQLIVISDENEDDEKAERRRQPAVPEKKPETAGRFMYRAAPGQPGSPWQAVPQPGSPAANPWGQRPLPEDMKVIIEKQGTQPATIVVEQGVKLWRTTQQEMDMLPAEARGYVARILGGARALAGGGGMMGAAHQQPIVKALPGGGVQIELREAGEQGQQEPARRQLHELRERMLQAEKIEAAKPAAGSLDRSRLGGPTEEQIRHQIHELQEQLQRLQRQLEKE